MNAHTHHSLLSKVSWLEPFIHSPIDSMHAFINIHWTMTMCELSGGDRVVKQKPSSELQTFFNFWLPEI